MEGGGVTTQTRERIFIHLCPNVRCTTSHVPASRKDSPLKRVCHRCGSPLDKREVRL